MQNKLKILMATEASFLSTGFANYSRELLTRLYNTDKYEIAEFSSYGHVNDPNDSKIPWRYYPNAVRKGDARYNEYMSSMENQFGRWRFDKVVIDFKPDVVIDIRDYWMSYYQQSSSFRKFFHWILMPTVDSAPQQQNWLDTYESADAIFTYSDFGARTLIEQTNNNINYIDTVSPGIDLEVFHPLDQQTKQANRIDLGIPADAIIVGSVMRNQKRKLIPELVKSFRSTLDHFRKHDTNIADRLYLYIHTSFPDAGWDIPEILKDEGVLNHVLITYSCKACNRISPSTFSGPRGYCPHCGNQARHIPSVAEGVSVETLKMIYNLMDIYVQYAICEGFGMPQVEAAACGIPIATVNYSAMEDIITKLKAYPIGIAKHFKELETKAVRVYPDDNSLKDILVKFISLPQEEKIKKQQETRSLTEKHYNWKDIALKWQRYLDSVKPRQDLWKQPASLLQPIDPDKYRSHNTLAIFTDICLHHIKDISLLSSNNILNMIQNIEYGYVQQGTNIREYKLEDAIKELNVYINNINNAENARISQYQSEEDYIKYSHIKASL